MRKVLLSIGLTLLVASLSAAADQPLLEAPPAPVVTATPTPSSTTPPPAASINPSAVAGNQSQNDGALINAVAGTALMTQCMASWHPRIALCVMGALALAQSGADMSAAGYSAQTNAVSGATQGQNETGTTPPPSNPAFGAGQGAFSDPAVIAGNQALQQAGYSVTPAGVTGPDGNLTPASAFGSEAGLAAAGLNPADFKDAKQIIAGLDTGSTRKPSGVGVSEGATGGASAASSDEPRLVFRPGMFKLSANDKKKMVAGKTVTFDGEPIGVRGQDIFEMVHVAYERKRERNYFIEAPANVTGARQPASVQNK